MGHRHLFSTSQMFENEQDLNWNHMHMEQSYANLARAGPAENDPIFYPVENVSVDGVQFTSHWNPAPMSSGYISLSHSAEVGHYQPDPSGPSHDPFMHSPNAGTFCAVPENYVHHASSSSYDRQTFNGIEGGFVDLAMGNRRGPHKRKSPGIPSACERGSTSRYHGAGTSSDLPLSSELQHEKPNLDPQYMPWELTMTPSNQGNLTLRAEGSTRNVRSRPALDLEANLVRTHLSNNSSHNSYSAIHPINHSGSVDYSGQSSSALTHDWNHTRMSPTHGRILVSDTTGFSHETNHFLIASSASNASPDIRGYHNDLILSRNPVIPQSFHGPSTHAVRGVRSTYSQRPGPTFRASSSNVHMGHVAPSDEGMQLVAESHSSRQPRPLSTIAWRNSDRNGRSRISQDRYRPVSNEAGLHEQFSHEGIMVVDRTALYGSRNMFDQHRDMRLDVDNMSYEELLALGERIGNVSTGLSENLISKCLTETVYFSPDQIQEGGACVICLEEYRNMDDIGVMKTCGHDYHVSCIKKWLSMKNVCPICKAPALADNMKNE